MQTSSEPLADDTVTSSSEPGEVADTSAVPQPARDVAADGPTTGESDRDAEVAVVRPDADPDVAEASAIQGGRRQQSSFSGPVAPSLGPQAASDLLSDPTSATEEAPAEEALNALTVEVEASVAEVIPTVGVASIEVAPSVDTREAEAAPSDAEVHVAADGGAGAVLAEAAEATNEDGHVGSVAENPGVQPEAAADEVIAGRPVRTVTKGADWERRIWQPSSHKCEEETDADPAWYLHKMHLLIFTYSGKPVYTRWGNEDGLSGTTGALSAIVSKMQAFFFNGANQDSLRYMEAGDHLFVFREQGPLWFVCISKCGNTYRDLVRLLDRVYLQMITILTTGVEKTLTARPNYDMRNLLGGTDSVVKSLVRWCTQDMYLQLDGFEPLPLSVQHRSIAVEALKAARIPNVLFGFLMAGHRIISIVTTRSFRPHALDLALVINLILSSASLRRGESWTPVCLTQLNDKAFVYAYISFIDETDVGVVFLSTASDGEQFYTISKHASTIKQTLHSSGCLAGVQSSMGQCPVDLRRERMPIREKPPLASFPSGQMKLLEGVIHAAYYVPALQQFFSSAIAPQYRSRRRTKMLFRMYGRCRYLLRTAKLPSHISVATDHECFVVSLASEVQLYLAVPRGISTGVVTQFYNWIKVQEPHLFLGVIPTW